MPSAPHTRLLVLSICTAVLVMPRPAPLMAQGTKPATNQTAATQDAFQTRLKQYLDLRDKLEAPLPKLPKEATPAQLDSHQRELGKLVAAARTTAKRGDIFTPDIETLARRLLARVFSGPTGRQQLKSVMDENPTNLVLKVNDRYPDTVPLSSMPPEILQSLPKLPETLEYRFVGDRLVLLDVPAHLIADFIDNALPKG